MASASEKNSQKAELNQDLARQRIHQAVARLGLSFADCVKLIEFDPDANTAYWLHNAKTGAESIHVGPAVADLNINCIEMVLRHELLHRSTYHGFGEKYLESNLSNLTLDICINRLLFEAYGDAMRELSSAIYPEESSKTPIALANCAADFSRLPDPVWRELWRYIWNRLPEGGFNPINPSSLYYRLLRLQFPDIPPTPWDSLEGGRKAETQSISQDSAMGRAARKVWEAIDERLPAGSALGSELCEISSGPIRIGTSRIEQFMRGLRMRRIADKLAHTITEPLENQVEVLPYPLLPSRLGLVYQACGLSDQFHLFWNRRLNNVGVRMALGIYLDVSGSMLDQLPLIRMLIERLKEYPLRLKTFDTELHEIDLDQLSEGKILGGGGTDFDPPIQDFVSDQLLVGGMLFTDGQADVSTEVGQQLRNSRKPLHVVYMLRQEERPSESALNHYVASSMVLHVQ